MCKDTFISWVKLTNELIDISLPSHFADEVAVIDEIQMIRDPNRGWAWTRALLGLNAKEVHVCGEASAIGLINDLAIAAGEEVEVRSENGCSEKTD